MFTESYLLLGHLINTHDAVGNNTDCMALKWRSQHSREYEQKKTEDIEWAIAYQLGTFAEAWRKKLGNYPAILKRSAWFLQL